MPLCPKLPWASIASVLVAISGCVMFCAIFADGIEGFLFQINTMAPVIGPEVTATIRLVLVYLALVFCGAFLLFLVVAVFATKAIASQSSPENRLPLYHRILSHRSTVALIMMVAHTLLILWLVVFCVCAMALILYVVFWFGMHQFCAFVDTQCFDFAVLVPIVKKLSRNKIDLVFCQEKKKAICDTNYLGEFIVSFLCSVMALLGIVYLLMCMSANYSRLSAMISKQKGKHYVMNMGTLESDSIIVQSMDK
uniref:G_PROTEIN_RECEP_F1_2 domain-containing protein n=1 Tax=Panagrellus redivivus TaxID=6233 RepID=A0A7E4VV28_PANRE